MPATDSRESLNELLTTLLREHEPAIRRAIRGKDVPQDDVDDVYQEVWIRVRKYLIDHGMDLPPYVGGTLKTIAANAAIDHLRKRQNVAAQLRQSMHS